MCLIKIIMEWIFACKVNENLIFINEKYVILTFTK